MSDVFISYPRTRIERAQQVANRLRKEGLSIFLDDQLNAGENWTRRLQAEIDSCAVVLGIWCREAFDRDWPMKECQRALQQQKLVPIAVEPLSPSDIPLQFESVQWIGFWDSSEREWDALLRALRRKMKHAALGSLEANREQGAMRMSTGLMPLISESTTSESTKVEVVLSDLKRGLIHVPDYQRDSQQWTDETKSLFIESIINNLAIPAFFFEPSSTEGREVNAVVDGQQRLTTLRAFYENDFALVDSDKAPYLSSQCEHYAGRAFEDLPPTFRETFLNHRLTIIKLRGLGDQRLEVFRRINQGGTPLSGQDIRLAYYGHKSPSVTFVRLAGIYDLDRDAARRFLRSAKDQFGMDHPWGTGQAVEKWRDLWDDKSISVGQTASEMFLWALVSAQHEKVSDLSQDRDQMNRLNIRSAKLVDEILDLYCAQLQFQDHNNATNILFSASELQTKFFPYFRDTFSKLVRVGGRKINVIKYRFLAMAIGAAYSSGKHAASISDAQIARLFQFIESPRSFAQQLKLDWPESKSQWHGNKGYAAQLRMTKEIVNRVLK